VDVDTSEAIDGLRAELLGVEARLTERIIAGEMATSELRAEMVTKSELRDEMASMKSELRDEIAGSRTQLQVLIEGVRDDVRVVAEAVAHLTVKIDKLSK
jgi:hypothetical protein